MATKNLSNAITALRAQVHARHDADKLALSIANQVVKEQAPVYTDDTTSIDWQ
ncbi:hypothetical protein L4D77_24575 [Photobacterium frigidiphilum]|uniref:hypothetical protein n=1 Tax=Photobacterium frigidiphilum TaxID=264736 RepID=UPI003D0C4762